MALGQSQPGGGGMGARRSILEAQGGMSGQANAQATQLAAQEQQRDIARQLQAREGAASIYGNLATQGLEGARLGAGMSEQDRAALLELEKTRAGVYGQGEAKGGAHGGAVQLGPRRARSTLGRPPPALRVS